MREEGYWLVLLRNRGVLDLGGGPSEAKQGGDQSANRRVRVRSGYLVNRLLSQVMHWESVFTVYRDLQPLFDHINLSTALHRLGRTSFKARVGCLSIILAPLALATMHESMHICVVEMNMALGQDDIDGRAGLASSPHGARGSFLVVLRLASSPQVLSVTAEDA